MNTLQKTKHLILGGGYLGQALQKRWPEALVTHRKAAADALVFDWHDEATWATLPESSVAVITFALSNEETLQNFLKNVAPRFERLIVIGSTSRYDVTSESVANESSNLDLSQERVQLEEQMRLAGGMIVASSGIIGPGREPERWLRSGRIRDLESYVNLVHVDDLAKAVDIVASKGIEKESYNASAMSFRWQDLADVILKSDNDKKFLSKKPEPKTWKIIDSSKLLALDWQPEWTDINRVAQL